MIGAAGSQSGGHSTGDWQQGQPRANTSGAIRDHAVSSLARVIDLGQMR